MMTLRSALLPNARIIVDLGDAFARDDRQRDELDRLMAYPFFRLDQFEQAERDRCARLREGNPFTRPMGPR